MSSVRSSDVNQQQNIQGVPGGICHNLGYDTLTVGHLYEQGHWYHSFFGTFVVCFCMFQKMFFIQELLTAEH